MGGAGAGGGSLRARVICYGYSDILVVKQAGSYSDRATPRQVIST